jgi:hypothetical protein
MSKTWRTSELEDYYYEVDISEAIEQAHESAYERAYQVQRQRELALWQRRNSDHGKPPLP